jgi:hypothetical protein
MKYIIILSLLLILLVACKSSSNVEKSEWVIELEELSKELEDISFQSNGGCECTVVKSGAISETIDTIVFFYNLKNIIKINTSYDATIRLEFKSYKQLKEKFAWRENISEEDKQNSYNPKLDRIVFYIEDKEHYNRFLYNIQKAAEACGAKVKQEKNKKPKTIE